MKYNEVKISLGHTINLGNYESRRVDFSVSAFLDDGDDVDNVISEVRKKCNDHLNKIIRGEPSVSKPKDEFDDFVF